MVAQHLMPEEMFPVCAPALLGDAAPPQDASALTRLPLIHDLTMAQAGVFPSWRHWLEHQGARPSKSEQGLKINSSAAVVQAALNGQGVALARRAFVSDELRVGRLLRLVPSVRWPVPWAYYVVTPEASAPTQQARRFVEWLTLEAEADLRQSVDQE